MSTTAALQPVACAKHKFFLVAFCRYYGDDHIALYDEGAPLAMEVGEPGFGADDDHWPMPRDRADYPLLVFEGEWQTPHEAHEAECGCDDPNGEECGWSYPEEWAWILGGEWRKATAEDLVRAGLVSDPDAARWLMVEQALIDWRDAVDYPATYPYASPAQQLAFGNMVRAVMQALRHLKLENEAKR